MNDFVTKRYQNIVFRLQFFGDGRGLHHISHFSRRFDAIGRFLSQIMRYNQRPAADPLVGFLFSRGRYDFNRVQSLLERTFQFCNFRFNSFSEANFAVCPLTSFSIATAAA